MLMELLDHFHLVARLMLDRRVNKWLKIFLIFIPLAYAFLPFPPDDFLPLLGLLDDLLLLGVTTIIFTSMCPEAVVREHKLVIRGIISPVRSFNLEEYRWKTENRDLAIGFVSAIATIILGGYLAGVLLLFFFSIGYIAARSKQKQMLASSVQVGPHQYPVLYEILKKVQMDLASVKVKVFIVPGPVMNAYTFGYGEPYTMVLTSALIENLSEAEMISVIGHEMGHILFGHVRIISIVGTQFGPGRLFFYKWSRSCEYSADAVALIVSQGNHIPLASALLKLTDSLPDSVDIEEVLSQMDGTSGTTVSEAFSTHPFVNNRIENLLRLIKQGGFRRRIGPVEKPRKTP